MNLLMFDCCCIGLALYRYLFVPVLCWLSFCACFFGFVLDFSMLCCVRFLLYLAAVVNDLHGRIFLVLFLLCIVLLNLVHVLFWCCVFFEFVLCFYVFPPCFGLVL